MDTVIQCPFCWELKKPHPYCPKTMVFSVVTRFFLGAASSNPMAPDENLANGNVWWPGDLWVWTPENMANQVNSKFFCRNEQFISLGLKCSWKAIQHDLPRTPKITRQDLTIQLPFLRSAVMMRNSLKDCATRSWETWRISEANLWWISIPQKPESYRVQ